MSPTARAAARRNRLLSVAVVVACACVLQRAVPDADARAPVCLALVVTLGYAHLLGALLGCVRSSRSRRSSPAGWAWGAPAGLLTAGFLPELLLPLLAVSVWHTVENDRALATAYGGTGRLAPLPRRFAGHATALAASASLAYLGAATLAGDSAGSPHHAARAFADPIGLVGTAVSLVVASRRSGRARLELLRAALLFALAPACARAPVGGILGFADLLALSSGYHLVQWVVLQLQRARCAPSARRVAHLVGVHLLAGAVVGLALVEPDWFPGALRTLLLSPGVFLFASALHVVHTAAARGIEPRPP